MLVRLDDRATRDIADIYDYLIERNRAAAFRVRRAIGEHAALLVDHPELGRPGRAPDTRELVVARTPYILVYRIERDSVVITRILHGARRWPEEFS